jgi:plasmid stabilization system protein ParE
MKVRYRELALSDLGCIFRFLDEQSPAGARQVIGAIHAAIGDIALNPLSGRATSDPTVRVKIVSRYGYKVFYSVEADAVEILHIRHGARRAWPAESATDKD